MSSADVKEIKKNKSNLGKSFLPYLVTVRLSLSLFCHQAFFFLFSCFILSIWRTERELDRKLLANWLWLVYGILTGTMIMVVVSVIGVTVQAFFLSIWLSLPVSGFRVVTAQGLRSVMKIILGLMGLSLVISAPALFQLSGIDPNANSFLTLITLTSYALTLGNLDGIISGLGVAATISTVFMFFSPLAQLKIVLAQKNSIFLNFNLSVVSLINCVAWFWFVSFFQKEKSLTRKDVRWMMNRLGTIKEDMFMMVPNSIGLGLSAIQLFLLLNYPSVPIGDGKKSSPGETRREEGVFV